MKKSIESETSIEYRYIQSPLGKLIIAATSLGCCLVQFVDSRGFTQIEEELTRRYKMKIMEGANPFLDQLEKELDQYFSGSRQTFTVPLDARGTTFQKAVWEQLISIPYGETKSYGEIARVLGKPKAARAVGKANRENCINIIVPCHRIIGSDQKLNNYNGGQWRKKELLFLEKQYS
ncbi:MAG: methylated-DNA--[protein]-cysteine S-methyltransferase [Candidatus Hodarchaeota archaeon]